jgi:3-methyladenine DNA glycosylase Mpg
MDQKITNFIKSNQLNELAKYLLFETHLVVNGNNYRMVEIELYICTDAHKDIFTHCHREQKNMLTWYFHQMSDKVNSYKGGTFKGMDITCAIDGGYGGILIRSVMDEATKEVIEGPCKTVDKILEKTKYSSIKDLVVSGLVNDLSCVKNNLLKLEEKHYESSDLYICPRIGLSMKGSDIDEKQKWVNNNYRFVIFKDNIKKEKKKMVKL